MTMVTLITPEMRISEITEDTLETLIYKSKDGKAVLFLHGTRNNGAQLQMVTKYQSIWAYLKVWVFEENGKFFVKGWGHEYGDLPGKDRKFRVEVDEEVFKELYAFYGAES